MAGITRVLDFRTGVTRVLDFGVGVTRVDLFDLLSTLVGPPGGFFGPFQPSSETDIPSEPTIGNPLRYHIVDTSCMTV